MGLMVHSLEGIPAGHHRDYYIYLLDYGWDEPLADALRKNFQKMATMASKQENAVVIMPSETAAHFADEVLSWHSINGDNANDEKLLPAILVTNRHPSEFRRRTMDGKNDTETNLKLVLFPLREHCKNTTEVIELIQKIFAKIKNEENLDDFAITKEKKRGIGRAIVNSILLEPNIAGMGFSFNKLVNYFKEGNKK